MIFPYKIGLTADCADELTNFLHPWSQLTAISELWSLLNGDYFADSLVFSTPTGNTGWTAFRASWFGYLAYHHWDRAVPSLLQLDMGSCRPIDLIGVEDIIKRHWGGRTMRAWAMSPIGETQCGEPIVFRDDAIRRPLGSAGLGPGKHLELELEFTCGCNDWKLDPTAIDLALSGLVGRLGMISMTAVQSSIRTVGNKTTYNGMVGITTSHIRFEVSQSKLTGGCAGQLEVFSCKDFEPEVVKPWLVDLFGSSVELRAILIDRHPAHRWKNIDFSD